MSITDRPKIPTEDSAHGADAPTVQSPPGIRPGDERFLAHLAGAGELVAARKYREAEVEVLRALSGLPADLRALNLLALVRFKLGRLEEARATYREIASAAPHDASARRNLGLLALKLERIEEAIPELEMAARLSPNDQRAWSYLGYAYAKKGEAVAAAAAFRRAGQDALATELEHAASARRPPTAPALAALQPPQPSGATPPPAPAPAELRSPGSVVAPAPLVLPAARPAPLAPAAPEAAAIALAAEVAPPEASEPTGSHEVVPVPLVAFVLSRLGLGGPIPAPRGEALRLAVSDEVDVHVRADAALAAANVRLEPAYRRMQGRRSAAPLGPDGAPFYRVAGTGEVWIAGAPGRWLAVSLDEDVLYVREDRVLAFDGAVSWEAGAVPGEGLRMLQFRGRGCVVLQLDELPAAVKVTEDQPAVIASARLLGWVGRLVAHKQRMNGPSPFQLTCQGDGVVLFDLQQRQGA